MFVSFKLPVLEQQSLTFLAPGTGFMEYSFSIDWAGGGWFQDDSSALHLLFFICVMVTAAPPQIIRDPGDWGPASLESIKKIFNHCLQSRAGL